MATLHVFAQLVDVFPSRLAFGSGGSKSAAKMHPAQRQKMRTLQSQIYGTCSVK